MTSNGVKGLFILQRRFAYIGHEMAKFLKEDGVVDEFCGYVQVRRGFNFLKEQKDITYTSLLLDEDIQKEYKSETLDLAYLKQLEREYGSISKFINVDRVIRHGQLIREYPYDKPLFGYEDLLKHVQVFAKRISAFLDREKPDFVFGYVFGSLGTQLIYEMARKRGIPVFSVIVPSTEHLVGVSESYKRLTGAETIFSENLKKSRNEIVHYDEARAFLDRFRAKPAAYSQVVVSRVKQRKWDQFDFLKPANLGWSLYYNLFGQFYDWWSDAESRGDYTTVHPLMRLWDLVVRKSRNLIGFEDLYDTFDASKPYTFYPLQYEPEVTLLLLGRFNTDQQNLIERIARSLPVGMYLYVKEHPAMVPYRTRSFYKRIRRIPNVKIIPPTVSSFDIIRSAALITTITSSVGWEATLLGKPVIAFGDAFYNGISSVAESLVPEELPALVAKQLEVKVDEEEVIRFLAALFEDCVSLDLMYLWEIEEDEEKRRAGFKKSADLLARKIRAIQ